MKHHHRVTLSDDGFNNYAFNWCLKQFGLYDSKWWCYVQTYCFVNEEDAILFSLRWK